MNTLIKNAVLAPFNLLYKVSPSTALRLLFRLKQGYSLNLQNPSTYSEKIQWIKLYDRNPLMPICSDKYAVRSYVEECGYGELLNELYWHGEDPANIPFDDMPDSFVIKVTHGSTFNIIVRDKSKLDRRKTVSTLRSWLKTDFLPCYGEWFYGSEGVSPCVIAERYLESDGNSLADYKVFVFEGKPAYILVCTGRGSRVGHYEDVYDISWSRIEGASMGYPSSGHSIPAPSCLDRMLEAAIALAKPFHHARVDFYVVNEKPVFGEITFTSGSGFDHIRPRSFDAEMGALLRLPTGGNPHEHGQY